MSIMRTSEYGIGEFTFPRGWFMIGMSEEVTSDKAMAIRYFGEDMVLYRGASGQIHCFEAYCAHMQTHLCKNTTPYVMRDGKNIEGDSIRCPYHAWRFGPDGKCDDIPYFDGPIPPAAKMFHETSREAFRQDFEIWANKRPAVKILQIPTALPEPVFDSTESQAGL